MSRQKGRRDEIIKLSDQKINYREYLSYVLSNSSPSEIEAIFKYRQDLMDTQMFTEEQIDERLLRNLATPDNVPMEIWMSLGRDDEEKEDIEYQNNNNQDESSEELNKSSDFDDNDDKKQRKRQNKNVNDEIFAQSTQINGLGGGFEEWPSQRIRFMTQNPPDESPLEDMQNFFEIMSIEDMQKRFDETEYLYFDRLGFEEIRQSVPIETEAIIMDPPLDNNGISPTELYSIFEFFRNVLKPPDHSTRKSKQKNLDESKNNNNNENTITDNTSFDDDNNYDENNNNDNYNPLNDILSKPKKNSKKQYLKSKSRGRGRGRGRGKGRGRPRGRSNSISGKRKNSVESKNKEKIPKEKKKRGSVIENCVFIFIWSKPEHYPLIDSAATSAGLTFCDTIVVEMLDGDMSYYEIQNKNGFVNHSKMVLIYKTDTIKSYKFAHQKKSDVGFGICRECGKSRGRLGTPQSPHAIIEAMLPFVDKKRIFVELWPTRMSPRPGWLFIDENC